MKKTIGNGRNAFLAGWMLETGDEGNGFKRLERLWRPSRMFRWMGRFPAIRRERKGLRGKKHLRKSRLYEEKESVKWQRASEEMRVRLDAETLSRTISVTDRESDVWEYLVDKTSHGERFVVRVSWNRYVVDERETQLLNKLESLPLLGDIEGSVSVKARGRKKTPPRREAEMAVSDRKRARVVRRYAIRW